MALTMLFYGVAAFIIAAYTRSVTVGFVIMAFFHWVFYKSVFGTGLITPFEYDIYYTLAFTLWTLLGVQQSIAI